jgi:hypothetical protein
MEKENKDQYILIVKYDTCVKRIKETTIWRPA